MSTATKNKSQIEFRPDGTIRILNVRLSYPHLFRAWAKNPEKEKAKFSGKFLMPNDTHTAERKLLQEHIKKLMLEAFKGKIPTSAVFLRNGDETGKEEAENTWVVSASEDTKPDVIHRDPKIKIGESDDIVYAGCWVNVLIKPWIQSNVHGKRINANLLAVQFVRDGTRFGAERPDVQEAFGDISGDFEDEGAGDASDFNDDEDDWDS